MPKMKFAHPNPDELKNHKNPIIQEIYNTMYKEHKNCLIVVVGDPGDGKSYTALGLCNTFDPLGFNEKTIRSRCITKPKSFIDKIVDDEKQLSFGSALLLDEAGTSIPAREWASWNNKAVDYIAQTFRYKRLLVVMTVPSMELVDVHIRKYFSYMFESAGVDYNNNLNICKIYKISSSKRDGKIYFIYPRFKKDGKRVKVTQFKFLKPNKKLCSEYERYSQEFKAELALGLKRMGEKIEAKELKRNIDVDDIVSKVMANKERYCHQVPSGLKVNKQLIEVDFKVGGGYSMRIKRLAEQLLKEKKPKIVIKDIVIKNI